VATLTVDPAGLEQAVVHVHALTGTHAPGTHWSDTMGGLRGVHLTASVATFDYRMSAVTREIAPFARVTDSLPLKRAEGTLPGSPPTEPVVTSTQVGTRAEAVPRGAVSSGRPLSVECWLGGVQRGAALGSGRGTAGVLDHERPSLGFARSKQAVASPVSRTQELVRSHSVNMRSASTSASLDSTSESPSTDERKAYIRPPRRARRLRGWGPFPGEARRAA